MPTPRQLRALSAACFGTAVPLTWQRMTDGVSTLVYRVHRGDERFYLRILPEEGVTFAPEVQAHRIARSLGCTVPEILAYEASNEMIQRSTMVTTEIPGQPLAPDSRPTRQTVESVRAAGRDLARINSIPVQGFGWIDRTGTRIDHDLRAEYSSLALLVDREYRSAIDQLPSDAVPGLAGDVMRQRLFGAVELVLNETTESRLAHGDLDTTHIYSQAGRYTGIIDFGEIRGTSPLYDLGHHMMHDQERLPYSTLGWLLDGYHEITPLSERDRMRIDAWSLLIAARALHRGLRHNPASEIVAISRRAISCPQPERKVQ